MTTPNLIWLIAMGVIGVVWAFEMFRMLWRIWRRANQKLDHSGGGYFTWAGHSLSGYGWFFTASETRPHRRRLVVLTVLMIAVVALGPLLIASTT